MGGVKKRSMKQMAKAQKKKPGAGKKKQETKARPKEKAIPGITQPDLKAEAFQKELKKMKVITPYSIATKFNLRLSIARSFLRDLERKGLIEFVSRSQHLRIYKPTTN